MVGDAELAGAGEKEITGTGNVSAAVGDGLVGPLFIVEGEKDVLAIEQLGGLATTAAFGAGTWGLGETRWLVEAGWTGCLVVVIDDDEAGWHHGLVTLKALATAGADWLVTVVKARVGKDAHDAIVGAGLGWFEAGPWWQPVDLVELLSRGRELSRAVAAGVDLSGSGATWHAKVAAWKEFNLTQQTKGIVE